MNTSYAGIHQWTMYIKQIDKYKYIYIYIYLEPKWPIFWKIWPIKWKVNPSKTQVRWFSRYIHIFHVVYPFYMPVSPHVGWNRKLRKSPRYTRLSNSGPMRWRTPWGTQRSWCFPKHRGYQGTRKHILWKFGKSSTQKYLLKGIC